MKWNQLVLVRTPVPMGSSIALLCCPWLLLLLLLLGRQKSVPGESRSCRTKHQRCKLVMPHPSTQGRTTVCHPHVAFTQRCKACCVRNKDSKSTV